MAAKWLSVRPVKVVLLPNVGSMSLIDLTQRHFGAGIKIWKKVVKQGLGLDVGHTHKHDYIDT